jgi:hypothetical protein
LADDLDELAVRYARLFNDSVAIAHDAVAESARTGRIEGAAEERKRARKARRARKKATVASAPAPVLDVDRPVRDVTTTALLRVVGQRVGRRLRRG